MLENSIYSVLSPEGFASILWKDAKKASEAAEVMKLTPNDLLKMGVIEGIIAEPDDHQIVCHNIAEKLQGELQKLSNLSNEELLARRYERFRKL